MNRGANKLSLISGPWCFNLKSGREGLPIPNISLAQILIAVVFPFSGDVSVSELADLSSPPWMWFLSHPPCTQRFVMQGPGSSALKARAQELKGAQGTIWEEEVWRRLTEKWPHPISATLAGFSLGWVIITHLPKTEIKPVCCFNFCTPV